MVVSSVDERRARTLDKVRKLLAKAQGTEFEYEAKAFEDAAERLMVDFNIMEFELAQGDMRNSKYRPEFREFSFDWDVGEFRWAMQSLLKIVARHCGAVPVEWVSAKTYIYRVFGYPADLDYIDVMYTNLAMHIVRTINPKWDSNKSEGQNLYDLRNAGFNWEQIWYMQHPKKEHPWERRHGVRYTNVVKKYAEKAGLPKPNPSSKAESYRSQFMQAFAYRLQTRLEELKHAHSNEQGLVLVSMKDQLWEALYEARPELRPHPANCACSKCRPTVSTAAARTRGRGAVYSGPTFNQHAWGAGTRSANAADLGQTRIQGNKGEVQ